MTWKVIMGLAILGIVLSSYLFYSFLFHPSFQPCSINAVVNCNAVIRGPVSTTLGIPTSLYGLVGYVFILVSALFKQKKLLIGMALFGLLFCLRITIVEVFYLKVICPVCLTCQIDMLTVFILSLLLLRKSQVELKS